MLGILLASIKLGMDKRPWNTIRVWFTDAAFLMKRTLYDFLHSETDKNARESVHRACAVSWHECPQNNLTMARAIDKLRQEPISLWHQMERVLGVPIQWIYMQVQYILTRKKRTYSLMTCRT